MARSIEMERRLQNWARWRLTPGMGVLGYAGVDLTDPTPSVRDPYSAQAAIPTNAIEAGETDDAVKLLPGELRRTVEVYYLENGLERRKLAKLCCSRTTLHDRIERAQRLLAEHFMVREDRRVVERRRVEALGAARW